MQSDILHMLRTTQARKRKTWTTRTNTGQISRHRDEEMPLPYEIKIVKPNNEKVWFKPGYQKFPLRINQTFTRQFPTWKKLTLIARNQNFHTQHFLTGKRKMPNPQIQVIFLHATPNFHKWVTNKKTNSSINHIIKLK